MDFVFFFNYKVYKVTNESSSVSSHLRNVCMTHGAMFFSQEFVALVLKPQRSNATVFVVSC